MTRLWPALGTAAWLLATAPAHAQGWDMEFGGHLKGQSVLTGFPGDSTFRSLSGSTATDLGAEARLKILASRGGWDVQADYQFIAIHSGLLGAAREGLPSPLPVGNAIEDDRRWFDLTQTIEDQGKRAVVQRLDRLSVGLATNRAVLRFGRQALSWGNGLVFTPMDIFNPFDPAQVDKEYKAGDDMLYGQFLFRNGDDLQAVAVVRRDPLTGAVDSGQSSVAAKYHGFIGHNEFDLLAAEHFGDRVLGLGGIIAAGGAMWRGDLTWTRTDLDEVLSGVVSVSYSWTWGGHNISGMLEFYRNGFGQPGGDYAPDALSRNPDLLGRIERGELFSLGRNYLAVSATVEVNPLFRLTPNLFVNTGDPSMLAQLVVQYDWQQDLQLLAALNLPVGPAGSEHGGIETDIPGVHLSTGASLIAQLAWYF